MSVTELELPILSLKLLSTSNGREVLGKQFAQAAKSTGFLQIVDHGVDQGLLKEAFEMAKRFFDLPIDVKMKLARDPKTHKGYELLSSQSLEGSLGSTAAQPGVIDESVQKARVGDQKEGLMMGDDKIDEAHPYWGRLGFGKNKLPDEQLPEMRNLIDRYHTEITKVSNVMMDIVAASVGQSPEESFAKIAMKDPAIALRFLHYPPTEIKTTTGIGAHTDFGLITLLSTSGTPGLELYHAGAWHSIEPLPNAFVLNIGDMLSTIIPGYKSSLHRVINKSGKDRYSVPVFVEGNLDFLVKPLGTTSDVAENGEKWKTVEETLAHRLGTSYK